MNWLSWLATAISGLIKGIAWGKKAKAEEELEQGDKEVKTAESNAARVEAELAEPPRTSDPRTTAPLVPIPPAPARGN